MNDYVQIVVCATMALTVLNTIILCILICRTKKQPPVVATLSTSTHDVKASTPPMAIPGMFTYTTTPVLRRKRREKRKMTPRIPVNSKSVYCPECNALQPDNAAPTGSVLQDGSVLLQYACSSCGGSFVVKP